LGNFDVGNLRTTRGKLPKFGGWHLFLMGNFDVGNLRTTRGKLPKFGGWHLFLSASSGA
jgi:hypothetical protein